MPAQEPLQGIHGKEVAVLQDVRYESFGLHWDGWLRWGENEPVKVKLPRNIFTESFVYAGTAPLFATMASPFQYPLAEARKTGRDVEYENGQFRSRWVTVGFRTAIPQKEQDPTLDPCELCGARWYAGAVDEAVLAAAGLVHSGVQAVPAAVDEVTDSQLLQAAGLSETPSAADEVTDTQLLEATRLYETAAAASDSESRGSGVHLAGTVAGHGVAEPVGPSLGDAIGESCAEPQAKRARLHSLSEKMQTSRADASFDKLRDLMEWRKSGLVDSPEFKAAKRELLGMP